MSEIQDSIKFFDEAIEFAEKCQDHSTVARKQLPHLKAAKSALEKQIDKKPVILREFNTEYGREYYACPNCEEYIRYKYTLETPTYPCRCGWCGQALDWSDTE